MKVFHLFIYLSHIRAEFLFLITTCGRTKTVYFLKVNRLICLSGQTSKNAQQAVGNVKSNCYLEIKIFKMLENKEHEPELHLPL